MRGSPSCRRDQPKLAQRTFLASRLPWHNSTGPTRRGLGGGGSCSRSRFTIHRYRSGAPGDNVIYLAQRERIYDGMRKAGVPER